MLAPDQQFPLAQVYARPDAPESLAGTMAVNTRATAQAYPPRRFSN